jgi:hypothetical protein
MPLLGIALRFGILIPLGLYQQQAKSHWRILGNHPEIGDAYDPIILLGEDMATKWVCTSSPVLSAKCTKPQKGSTEFPLPPSRPDPVYFHTCAGEHHLRYI